MRDSVVVEPHASIVGRIVPVRELGKRAAGVKVSWSVLPSGPIDHVANPRQLFLSTQFVRLLFFDRAAHLPLQLTGFPAAALHRKQKK